LRKQGAGFWERSTVSSDLHSTISLSFRLPSLLWNKMSPHTSLSIRNDDHQQKQIQTMTSSILALGLPKISSNNYCNNQSFVDHECGLDISQFHTNIWCTICSSDPASSTDFERRNPSVTMHNVESMNSFESRKNPLLHNWMARERLPYSLEYAVCATLIFCHIERSSTLGNF